jgi:Plavaka transposase
MCNFFPQVSRKEQSTVAYQRFSRQLFHACLAYVYAPLKPAMTVPEVVQCPDGLFRCAIYSIGPYIADYPEQVWLTGIVQNWCPKYASAICHFCDSCSDVLLCRCDARPGNLDDFSAHRRTHEKTDLLLRLFDPGIVWDEYGLRSDVVVRHGWT